MVYLCGYSVRGASAPRMISTDEVAALMTPIVLASQSPRRKELLRRVGIPFQVFVPDVDEHCDLPAAQAVALLSARKASACAPHFPGRFILAADTLVSLENRALGKPGTPEEAFRMLSALSGHTHQVMTGVSVLSPTGEAHTAVDITAVTFAAIPEAELRAYIATGEPMDKAGAYGIQGRAGLWVTHLDGCDSSVIGLPLYLVRRLLLDAGYCFPA